MFAMPKDKSIVDRSGKVLLFSTERFIDDIVQGDCCIICGCKENEKGFNDEHVLPQWILRQYNLFDKFITLPNDSSLRYGCYTIPCCLECNLEMARALEDPISRFISQGSKEVSLYFKDHSPWPIFIWLALIFFKVHYKDKSLRHLLDLRRESPKISDFYEWSDLHHVHCLSRSFYTSCIPDKSVFGTLFVLPARTGVIDDDFDFLVLQKPQSILVKLGDIAFIAVLNDSGAGFSLCQDAISRIRGPLSTLQLREILSVVSTINLHLKSRPRFYSKFDPISNQFAMFADHPKTIEMDELYPEKYGEILHYCCSQYIPFIREELGIDDIEMYLKNGQWTFLFDSDGNFSSNSL